MAHQPTAERQGMGGFKTPRGRSCAPTGKQQQDAKTSRTTANTNARAVERRIMELRTALERRKHEALTPYRVEEWEKQLRRAGMVEEARFIGEGLRKGFVAGIPTITRTYAPPNKSSIREFEEPFNKLVQIELEKERYLGPLSRTEMEELIGPFQTSPLNIIPKPGKPGKFRLIQNLSHPFPSDGESSQSHITSINHHIESDKFPCTWGTFSTVCLLISRLPPGTQAAVRDVKEAYRTVPLHHSQWPGIVIRLQEDSFALDTCNCFGLASGAGCYGRIGDAGAQLLRLGGIGPICKWVDDHIFFRIQQERLQEYNTRREGWAEEIAKNGGRQHDGGRIWFRGKPKPDGKPEEFDEDCQAVLRDLAADGQQRADSDMDFAYSMADIDEASNALSIPWEKEKDVQFSTEVPFVGFLWNLSARTVSLTPAKRQKYLEALLEWQKSTLHNLEDTQRLYGKLLHACHILPAGQAYLTSLEAFTGIFNDRPFMPRTPPKHTSSDLDWWRQQLENDELIRPIPTPQPIIDLCAFSDTSSEVGIGIIISRQWRAWRLIPGWKSEGRDIGWAEAIGFLLLALTVVQQHPHRNPDTHFRLFGDNKGVVEGWWKGRSRNRPTNLIFQRIHQLCATHDINLHTRYVISEENPADGPSRGIYGPPPAPPPSH
jgi:hypothetical protein